MAIAPATVVKLYEGVPWSKDDHNFRYFGSYTERNKYFNETLTPKAIFTEFTYLRNEPRQPIAVPIGVSGYDPSAGDTIPGTIGNIMRCNYMFYQNPSYAESWFCAFVTEVRYINDGTAWIYFEEDSLQSWGYNLSIDSGLIERETVANDTIGAHTLDEGFNGNYVMTAKKHSDLMSVKNMIPVIFLTEPPLSKMNKSLVGMDVNTSEYFECADVGFQNGFQSTLYALYLKNYGNYYAPLLTSKPLSNFVSWYMQIDASVVGCRFVPSFAISDWHKVTIANEDGERWKLTSPGLYTPPYTLNIGEQVGRSTDSAVSRTVSGSGYKNNKIYTSPYVKLIADFNGSRSEYAYENFKNGAKFTLSYTLGLDSDVTCKADSYCISSSTTDNNNTVFYQMKSNGSPNMTWTKDSLSQWYAYNNVAYRAVGATVNTLTGFGGQLAKPSGNVGFLFNIPDLLAEMYQADRAPDTVGETGFSATSYACNDLGLNTYCFSYRAENLKSIDNFFSLYGYKVMYVAKPNITTRKNWNFLKMNNAHVSGNAPANAKQYYERVLNEGLTFWHKNDVGNYGNLDNPIV